MNKTASFRFSLRQSFNFKNEDARCLFLITGSWQRVGTGSGTILPEKILTQYGSNFNTGFILVIRTSFSIFCSKDIHVSFTNQTIRCVMCVTFLAIDYFAFLGVAIYC